jgi:transcriptional regulator with XRE-family HTH domain
MDVGSDLRWCRKQGGLSQQALADASGTSQPTVAAYEAGRVIPSVPTLTRLLEACGYTIDVVTKPATPRWTRVEEKSLAVNRLIAARLLNDPVPTLHRAKTNLTNLRSSDRGHSKRLLDEWSNLLERPVDQIVIAMLARTTHGIDLRQMTPFAGVLTDAERRKALSSVPSTDAA